MADAKAQIGLTGQFLEGTAVDTTAGTDLFREGVSVGDPQVGAARARVVATQPAQDEFGLVVRPVDAQVGAWGYLAGVSGTAVVSGRILQISATTGDNPASFTIDGGDTIVIPSNQHLTVEPRGNLVDPTLVFSGTASYFVEFVS